MGTCLSKPAFPMLKIVFNTGFFTGNNTYFFGLHQITPCDIKNLHGNCMENKKCIIDGKYKFGATVVGELPLDYNEKAANQMLIKQRG